MDQGAVLEPLEPLLSHFAMYWLEADAAHNRKFSAEEQLDNGATLASLYRQRQALKQMRIDPAVSGYFRPAEVQRLQFLEYDGVGADIGLMFRKLRWYKGKLYSGGIETLQRIGCKEGFLPLNGKQLLPLVCGPTFVGNRMNKIYLGEEGPSGFPWYITLWSDEGGLALPNLDPQPLLPGFRAMIKRPDVAASSDGKIVSAKLKLADDGSADKRSTENSA